MRVDLGTPVKVDNVLNVFVGAVNLLVGQKKLKHEWIIEVVVNHLPCDNREKGAVAFLVKDGEKLGPRIVLRPLYSHAGATTKTKQAFVEFGFGVDKTHNCYFGLIDHPKKGVFSKTRRFVEDFDLVVAKFNDLLSEATSTRVVSSTNSQ